MKFFELLEDAKKYVHKFNESSVDFPSTDLPLDIWDKEDDKYVLNLDLKTRIFQALSAYPKIDLMNLAKQIHIVGSIGTNLFDDEADIDIHIIPHEDKLPNNIDLLELQKDIMNWFKNNRDENNWYVNKHPFEVYLQLDPTQDYYSDTMYDLFNDEWVKPFKKYDMSYNPYEIYGGVFDEIQKLTSPADVAIGELRRDVIDYNRLSNAMKKLDKDNKIKLKDMLQGKLDEIEVDINNLSQNKDIWRAIRRRNSGSSIDLKDDLEQLKTLKHSDEWNKDNFIFKIIDRYYYMNLINNLNKLIEDGHLENDDVPKIEKILKDFNSI